MQTKPVTLDDGLEKLQAFITQLTQATSRVQSESAELETQHQAMEGDGREAGQGWQALEQELQDAAQELERLDEEAEEALGAVRSAAGQAAQMDLPQAAGSVDEVWSELRDRTDGARRALHTFFERFEEVVERGHDGIEQDRHTWSVHEQETGRRFDELEQETGAAAQAIEQSGDEAGQSVEQGIASTDTARTEAPEAVDAFAGAMMEVYLQALITAGDELEPELEASYRSLIEEVQQHVLDPMWEQLSAVVEEQAAAHLLEEPLPAVIAGVARVLEHPAGEMDRAGADAEALFEYGEGVLHHAEDLAPDLKRAREVAAEVDRLLEELAGA